MILVGHTTLNTTVSQCKLYSLESTPVLEPAVQQPPSTNLHCSLKYASDWIWPPTCWLL